MPDAARSMVQSHARDTRGDKVPPRSRHGADVSVGLIRTPSPIWLRLRHDTLPPGTRPSVASGGPRGGWGYGAGRSRYGRKMRTACWNDRYGCSTRPEARARERLATQISPGSVGLGRYESSAVRMKVTSREASRIRHGGSRSSRRHDFAAQLAAAQPLRVQHGRPPHVRLGHRALSSEPTALRPAAAA